MKKMRLLWIFTLFLIALPIVSANTAPNATGIIILPENATAGHDLLCNYTYLDPENYSEKDSTYYWKKDGVDQNIDSQTLDKNNLSVGDKWSCEVIPSDGLANGTKVVSDNITILSTVQNPKIYVEDTLTWNSAGYYSETEFVLNLTDELNTALDSCTPDAEGFCNITLTFSSDASGKLNLSNLGIYYEELSINSISASPSVQGFGENVTIEANITDVNGSDDIDTVLVGITPPGESETNYTMSYISGDIWQYTFADFSNGTYDYTVYVNDSTAMTDSRSGTFDMYINLYSNIRTLKDSYVDNELVNITDPPEDALVKEGPPKYLITKDNAWTILKQDYITKHIKFKFTYLNDSYYRLDWKWKNYYVKNVLRDCSSSEANKQSGCIKNIADKSGRTLTKEEFTEKHFPNHEFSKIATDFSSLKNNPLPKKVVVGSTKLIGDINPYSQEEGNILINLEDSFYNSNGLRIKLGFNTTLAEFNNSKTEENLTFMEAGNFTRYLKIEKESVITESTISLKGYEKWLASDFIDIDHLPSSYGVATVSGSYFWVTDPGQDRIYKVNTSGSVIGNYSISGFGCGSPRGITTVDGTNFWIVDYSDDKLYKTDSSFNYVSDFSTDGTYADDPYGAATASGSYFWITDESYVVYKFDSSGNYVSQFDTTDAIGNVIEGITTISGNYFWIVNGNSPEVYKLNSSGGYIEHVDTYAELDGYQGYSYNWPRGITEDGTDVWLEESGDDIIYKLTQDIPTNATIDSGNDGSDDYVNNSKINKSVTVDLNITAIQNYLDSCTADAEGYCYAPIVFSSATGGKLEYSNISIVYEDTQSKIRNDATTNTSVYLLMWVHYWNGNNWMNEKLIHNDDSPRRIQPGENNQLKLDAIWNPNAWDTSTNIHGNGTYRAWVAATDENDNILENVDGTQVAATYNFTIAVNSSVQPNKIYTFRNSSGSNVAYFDDLGNLVLKGNCTYGGVCSAPSGSVNYRNSSGDTVAYLDNNGNLCIETGDCSGNSPSCNPSNRAFTFRDSSGTNAAYIDLTNGDLCLTGGLEEYGNP